MKEKGTSWAYATPGFGASLSASNLRQLRQLTGNSSQHFSTLPEEGHGICLPFSAFQPVKIKLP